MGELHEGLGDFFDSFTGFFTRTIPKAAKYAGVYSVGFLMPAGFRAKVFDLSARESKQAEVAAKVQRGAALATAGIVGGAYAFPALFGKTAVAGGAAKIAPFAGSVTPKAAFAAEFGAPATASPVLTPAGLATAGFGGTLTPTAAPMGTSGLIASGFGTANVPLTSTGTAFAETTTGKLLIGSGKAIGTAALTVGTQIGVQAAMQKGQEMLAPGGEGILTAPPTETPAMSLPFPTGGGGGSSSSEEGPAQAAMPWPMILIGGGLAATILVGLLRKPR
jgi:hypothetical protein